MMTREDALRELELLPVWQLRAPLVIEESTQNIAKTVIKTVLNEAPPIATLAQALVQKTAVEFDVYQSENNAWVFICTQDSMAGSRIDTASQACTGMSESSGMLLDNLFFALQIKAKKYVGDLKEVDAKVIIAMGEKTAQTLLNSTETIDNLRGKTLLLHNLPLIVTYSAGEMLEHLPNKAKTWDDLCMALSLVNA